MNDIIIREAAAADIPQMCSLFQNDLGYAECTLEIVEKQFAGLDAKRAEQWALEHKINTVRLNSGGTRTQAHQFYRAQGYVDDKTQLRFIKNLK